MKGLNLLKSLFGKEDTLGIPDSMLSVSNGQTILANGLKSVAVTVALGQTTGTVTDSTLIGGTVIGVVPTGNQDQLIDNITINGSGVVTVTLAAAATAANTFRVTVAKA